MSTHGTAYSLGQYNEVEIAVIRALPKALEGTDPKQVIKVLQNGGQALEERLGEYFRALALLLEVIGTVKVAATSEPFEAGKKFVLNYGPRAKPGVRIAYLGENFQKRFLPKVEEPRAETVLRYARLSRIALDKDIRAEIGKELEETTLAEIYSLMERQPKGEDGVLLTDGRVNIFHAPDALGRLRAVSVCWDVGYGGWYVGADAVSHPLGRHGGGRVFSRNSCTSVTQTV